MCPNHCANSSQYSSFTSRNSIIGRLPLPTCPPSKYDIVDAGEDTVVGNEACELESAYISKGSTFCAT